MAADPWAVQSVQPEGGDDGWAVKSVEPQRKRSMVEDVTGFMSKVNRGLGIGDELAAGAGTVVNALTGQGPQGFSANMAHQRQIEDSYQAEHPHVAALATGTGNALTAAAPVGPGAEAFATGGRAINALRGATVGGLTGAGYAAVDRGSLEDRAGAAAHAAHDPVTLGLGAAAGALATPRATRAERPAAPTLDELSTQRDAAYRAVDDSGVTYAPDAFRSLTQDMARTLDENGFHAGLHPKTAAMMERLGQSERAVGGYAPTLTQLDQLRQQIGRDIASSADAGERRMGQLLRGQIDDFIAGAGPEHINAGDPQAASELIGQARDLHGRVAKIRSLDNLDEAAADRASVTGSGGNINNATRQNVLRFRNQNERTLTPDEQAAAQRVIDGTPAGNALRQLGKLSPRGNGLMLAGHLAAAVPTHGVSGGVAIGGAVAKAMSDAITTRNVQALRELIASGGEAAQAVSQQLADPQYADLRAQLANDLAAQAGVQGASRHEPAPAVEVTIGRSTNPEHLAWRRAQGLR